VQYATAPSASPARQCVASRPPSGPPARRHRAPIHPTTRTSAQIRSPRTTKPQARAPNLTRTVIVSQVRSQSLSLGLREPLGAAPIRSDCALVVSDRQGFRPDVIVLAVGWYLRFALSYRDVEELDGARRWCHADRPSGLAGSARGMAASAASSTRSAGCPPSRRATRAFSVATTRARQARYASPSRPAMCGRSQ
jgi:hypothetical protein